MLPIPNRLRSIGSAMGLTFARWLNFASVSMAAYNVNNVDNVDDIFNIVVSGRTVFWGIPNM